jgi:hypothetical protein
MTGRPEGATPVKERALRSVREAIALPVSQDCPGLLRLGGLNDGVRVVIADQSAGDTHTEEK